MNLIIWYLWDKGYVYGIQAYNYRFEKAPDFIFNDIEITPKGIIFLEDIAISEKKEKLFPYDINEYDAFQ